MKKIFMLSGITLLLAACNSTKNSSGTNFSLEDTRWKLVQLNGKEVVAGVDKREAFIQLLSENSRITGNGGCNVFNGTYELSEPNRIRFSRMATTQMACPNLDSESEFFKVLENADSYYLRGDTLQLIRARMAPLAILIASNQ